MKKCPFCAQDIQDEAIKCRYCWEFLVAVRPKLAKQKVGRGVWSGVGMFFGFLLNITLIIAFVSLIYFGFSSIFAPGFSNSLRFIFTRDFLTSLKELLVPTNVISKIAYFYLLGFFIVLITKGIHLYIDRENPQPSEIKAVVKKHHLLKRTMVLGSGVVAGFAFIVLVLLSVFRHWDDANAPRVFIEPERFSTKEIHEIFGTKLVDENAVNEETTDNAENAGESGDSEPSIPSPLDPN